MNARDRKELTALQARLLALKDEADEIREAVGALADAEREKYDNMSEGLQESEKGQAISEAADTLDNIKDALERYELETAEDEFSNLSL